jgi:hypothetical protein
MTAQTTQSTTFLYMESDVAPGVELREWRRLNAPARRGIRQRLRRARHHGSGRDR